MKLRKLNERGLQTFREFLQEARHGATAVRSVPISLMTWPVTSEEIVGAPELDAPPTLINRFELASYLHEALANVDTAIIEGRDGGGDPGFWAALSLFYFETLTPGYEENGNRILADNCYIPEVESALAGVRYFRHRLAGAYRLFNLYGDLCRPLLLSSPGVQNGLYTEITDSVFYTETRCVVEAVNLLYYDHASQRLKFGWNSKEKPGALPRLLAVIDQLDLTYDLQGIGGARLLRQLPREFDAWCSR